MTGVTVQVGPRSVGRHCAAWGLAIARDRFLRALVLTAVAFEVTLVGVMLMLGHAAQQDRVPAIFTPAPSAFCPAGQHVTGTDASGWPVCKANR